MLFISGRPNSVPLPVFRIDVDGRRIAGGIAEPHVVGFEYRATDLVVERQADRELFEPTTSHWYFPREDGREAAYGCTWYTCVL